MPDAAYYRAWYAKNSEKRRADRRAYLAKNREQVNERAKQLRLLNLEEARRKDRIKNKRSAERRKTWAANNKEKCRANERAYTKRHLHIGRAKSSRRRALNRGAEGSFTRQDVERIFAAQKGRCIACGSKGELTVDHIVPLARGGTNWPSNIQGLCLPCNAAKRDRDPVEFAQSRGLLL